MCSGSGSFVKCTVAVSSCTRALAFFSLTSQARCPGMAQAWGTSTALPNRHQAFPKQTPTQGTCVLARQAGQTGHGAEALPGGPL